MKIQDGQRCEWCGNVSGIEECVCGPVEMQGLAVPEIDKLRAEVERLREALTKIAVGCQMEHAPCTYARKSDKWCFPCIARAALEGKP